MSLRLTLAIGLSLCFAGSGVSARQLDTSPAPTTPPGAPDIVVQGQSSKTAPKYVDKLAVSNFGRQVSRWRTPVCLTIKGMSETYANQIRQRFNEVARTLRVGVVGGRCKPNITMLLTDRPDTITRSLLTRRIQHVDLFGEDPAISDRQKAIALTPRTVRWFTVTETLNSDGTRSIQGGGGGVGTWSASLVRKQTVEGLAGVMIVIDETRLVGVTMTQLSDYTTLVALTEPDMGADYTGTDSILALFTPPDGIPKPSGLTKRDLDFLRALYSGGGQMTGKQQKATIAREMRR